MEVPKIGRSYKMKEVVFYFPLRTDPYVIRFLSLFAEVWWFSMGILITFTIPEITVL